MRAPAEIRGERSPHAAQPPRGVSGRGECRASPALRTRPLERRVQNGVEARDARQHDREIGVVRAQSPGKLEAVHRSRHHDVAEHKIGLDLGREAQRLPGVACGMDGEAQLLQVTAGNIRDLAVVLDEKGAPASPHGADHRLGPDRSDGGEHQLRCLQDFVAVQLSRGRARVYARDMGARATSPEEEAPWRRRTATASIA